ncbi:MAG: DUF493 domain-containing protein [Mariprofundus sp.]|nr:DUF493 domain-containing protein [Mariprofundus sp.]
MNKSSEIALLTFPCHFPIKVMGNNKQHFQEEITAIAREHIPLLNDNDIKCTASRTGKYLSITITITAESRAQLDSLYLAFNAHSAVQMVL